MSEQQNSLKISEAFFSCQAEGVSTGIPAIFIRLSGCNLMCGGPNGIFKKQGKATWWCDTEAVWRNGTHHTNEELLNKFKEWDQLDNVLSGRTRLVWTGGEPTMPNHVISIMKFLDFINEKFPNSNIFNEIETNGTIPIIEDKFYAGSYIHQINCSPKLAIRACQKT